MMIVSVSRLFYRYLPAVSSQTLYLKLTERWVRCLVLLRINSITQICPWSGSRSRKVKRIIGSIAPLHLRVPFLTAAVFFCVFTRTGLHLILLVTWPSRRSFRIRYHLMWMICRNDMTVYETLFRRFTVRSWFSTERGKNRGSVCNHR